MENNESSENSNNGHDYNSGEFYRPTPASREQ